MEIFQRTNEFMAMEDWLMEYNKLLSGATVHFLHAPFSALYGTLLDLCLVNTTCICYCDEYDDWNVYHTSVGSSGLEG